MATGHEQHEPVRQDATDCALLTLLGRGRPASLHPRVFVFHFQVRGRLLSITRVPKRRATGERRPLPAHRHQTALPPHPYQAYEVVEGRFVRREKDRADVIGYDNNQLFGHPDGIARIVLNDNVSPPP